MTQRELNFCKTWHQRYQTTYTSNFSYLNQRKFRHGFQNTVDPMCRFNLEAETTLDFLYRYRLYYTIRTEHLDDIYTVVSSLTNYSAEKLLNFLVYSSEHFSVKTNQSILKSTIKLLKNFKRFDDPPLL